MQQMEIKFKCLHCGEAVEYIDTECGKCKHGLAWGRVHKDHEDKYLVVYEVLV